MSWLICLRVCDSTSDCHTVYWHILDKLCLTDIGELQLCCGAIFPCRSCHAPVELSSFSIFPCVRVAKLIFRLTTGKTSSVWQAQVCLEEKTDLSLHSVARVHV